MGGIVGGIVGALVGGKSGGGGGTQTTQTIQKADPWEGVQPALSTLYNNAVANWNSGGPFYYPGNTFAGRGATTVDAQRRLSELATQPDGLLNDAQSQARGTINGNYLRSTPGYDQLMRIGSGGSLYSNPALQRLLSIGNGSMLNGNPYVDAMFKRASGAVGEDFRNNVMPGIASQFSAGGRYGSNAMQEGLGQAERRYGDTLNNLATDIYGGNYVNERGLMQQALGTAGGLFGQERGLQQQALQELGTSYGKERLLQQQAGMNAPGLSQASYFPIAQLTNLGATQDLMEQARINSDIERWNFNQNSVNNRLATLSGLLQGAPMGSQGSSSVNTPGSPLLGALGGFQLGSSIGGSLGGLRTGAPSFANLGTITGDDASIFW